MARAILFILFGVGLGFLIASVLKKVEQTGEETPEEIIDGLEARLKDLELELND